LRNPLDTQLAHLDRVAKEEVATPGPPSQRSSPWISRPSPGSQGTGAPPLTPDVRFDFGAKLDDLIGGDPEELGRMRRNASQSGIETLAPSCHPGTRGRFVLPARIAGLETQIAELNAALADPDLYARDPARFGATTEALAVVRDELAVAEEQWLRLEMLREEIEAAEPGA
jgi:ABC transporter C-terminal domain